MSKLSETNVELGLAEQRVKDLLVEKSAINNQADSIKSEIDELRRQWEYLDNEGSQPEKQSQLSRRIGKLQDELKYLIGEEY